VRHTLRNQNLQSVKSKLRSSLPGAFQLSVKGIPGRNGSRLYLPRNVVRHMVGPKRLPGVRVAPVNTGVSRVNTSLFENEEEYYEFKKNIEEDVEIEICSVSRFIDDEIKIEVLIDNGPKVDSAGFTIEDN